MQAGFAFLEAGSVRSKNTTNILLKNTLDLCKLLPTQMESRTRNMRNDNSVGIFFYIIGNNIYLFKKVRFIKKLATLVEKMYDNCYFSLFHSHLIELSSNESFGMN